MSTFLTRYGDTWRADGDDLAIELEAIALGGRWKNGRGQDCGIGLFDHMMNARKLLWPKRYRHRWTDLMYHNFIENDTTILMGAASSQKTSHASEYSLIRYWSSPENTLVILSTMTMDKLDTGVFGEIKMLWQDARQRYEWLPGNLLEHRRAITTDNVADGEVRDFRKGIIGRPVYVSGKYVGIGVLAGTKQANIIWLADELSWMGETFVHI